MVFISVECGFCKEMETEETWQEMGYVYWIRVIYFTMVGKSSTGDILFIYFNFSKAFVLTI